MTIATTNTDTSAAHGALRQVTGRIALVFGKIALKWRARRSPATVAFDARESGLADRNVAAHRRPHLSRDTADALYRSSLGWSGQR